VPLESFPEKKKDGTAVTNPSKSRKKEGKSKSKKKEKTKKESGNELVKRIDYQWV
jgi:hypothetical protein